jgi:Protein of unknown function (DUF2950)
MPSLRQTARSAALVAALVTGVAHAGPPQYFPTPDAAVQALVEAAKSGEDAKVLAVMGSGAKRLVESGDAVADRNVHERFVTLYDEAHALVPESGDRRVLQVGTTGWPFPIPLVKGKTGWFFDTADGLKEVLARRVGQNELDAIQVCLAIADAQHDYVNLNPEHATPAHYAGRFLSSPGKRDGLYWPTVDGEPLSPLGAEAAHASAAGYEFEHGKATPYHGYYYRLLSAQGSHAEGGAIDYKVKGELYGGFALVAYPAEYGNSGVMTFITNYSGVVFQKDLGKDTATRAKAMKTFDPDSSWTKAPTSSEAPDNAASPPRAP